MLTMNRCPSRPSRSARRSADIWTVRFAGSTKTLGQTRAIKSCLLTNSPWRSRCDKRIGSERRSDVYPFVEILRQDQIAGGGVLGQLTGLCLRAAARERLYEEGRCDRTARNQRGHCQKFCAHRCSPIALVKHRNSPTRSSQIPAWR